ncbi:MAG: regulatory protein RecX [Dehalococcoidales bacterium]|jgi:regulatory protein|nr:regulatory protein RecX [Dehalococcoidales bacterium]MDD4794903.1 regulatory protein RecX [Dehalococcoidales bacterium]MDD5122394.1 regulatory protein RecX [Dehalococcoidales bacterium]
MMGFITGLEMNKARNRARLYIDGCCELSLPVEVVFDHKLKTGMEISQAQIEFLKEDEEVYRCKQSAYRLLAFRARSEYELSERLARKGFGCKAVEKTIKQLKNSGLINDAEFGRQWAESRLSFKPQSAFLTRRELKEKGLSEEAVEEAVKNYDDYQNAIMAARSRAMRSNDADYSSFKRRIGSFLQRRGFGYGVIKPVTEELWKEKTKYQEGRENLQ